MISIRTHKEVLFYHKPSSGRRVPDMLRVHDGKQRRGIGTLGSATSIFSRDTLLWGYTMHLPEQSRPNRQLRSNEPEL